MAEQIEIREQLRWRHMKALRYEGFDFVDMVKPLQALGLLECRNCEAGTPITRTTATGDEICTTCEDTITQFWRRNLRRLATEEAEVLEVKGGWIEAHLYIAQTCRKNAVITAEVITERTENVERVETVNGQEVKTVVPVTVRTVRRERRVNLAAVRLLSEVHDKMAKMAGFDLADPDFDQPVPRKKLNVRREEPAEVAN